MPIYEFKKKCEHDEIIDVVASVKDRNVKKVYCSKCEKDVPAQRVLSKPLIKIAYGFSDFSDKSVRKELGEE